MNEDLYGEEFFAGHVGWRQEYHRLADIIVRMGSFQSVIDLGCGNGYMLEQFRDAHRKDVVGVERSEAARAHFPDIIIADLGKPLPDVLSNRWFDLVLCTEVAEHLPESEAEQLVDNICSVSKERIIFSAAKRGRGGTGHINEQEMEYWVAKFVARKFFISEYASMCLRWEAAKATNEIWWFPLNLMVFTKGGN